MPKSAIEGVCHAGKLDHRTHHAKPWCPRLRVPGLCTATGLGIGAPGHPVKVAGRVWILPGLL